VRWSLLFICSLALRAQEINPSMELMNVASGTASNPAAWNMPMIMRHYDGWMAMFMANGFIVDTQQSGPRGADKFYSPNMFMGMVQHSAGSRGVFQLDAMLSLEPATVTDRRYPLLFQTGETAFGNPIVDAQHPHNFIMGLGVHYAYRLAENTLIDAYFAPVGDPALGPVAYPHRASAMEIPQATLSHHRQDSTHISDDVVTVGITHRKIRVEASGFHGAEPGENRWIIQQGAMDSYSGRVWFFPSENWAAQVSLGRLSHPEALEPGDRVRSTASLHYTKGSWSSSFIWGRDHQTESRHDLNSYLGESVFALRQKNYFTGRFELVDKDELIVPGIHRIAAYTVGYTRDIGSIPHLRTGLGANVSWYSIPDTLRTAYGDHPVGVNIFLRLRLQ
jgi:hypothetical protein